MLHNYTLKIIYHTDRINTYQLYPHVRLLLPMKPACQRSAATRILYQTALPCSGYPYCQLSESYSAAYSLTLQRTLLAFCPWLVESLPLLNQLAFSLFNGSLYILFAFATRGRGCITPDLRPKGSVFSSTPPMQVLNIVWSTDDVERPIKKAVYNCAPVATLTNIFPTWILGKAERMCKRPSILSLATATERTLQN